MRLFDFSYKDKMSKFIELIAGQSWMRVVAAMQSAHAPRGVRELADLSGLSVAGVHDVLRRLRRANVVNRVVIGSRPFFKLNLNEEDHMLLENILQRQREQSLRDRAALFSARVPAALTWIDPMLATLRRARVGRVQ